MSLALWLARTLARTLPLLAGSRRIWLSFYDQKITDTSTPPLLPSPDLSSHSEIENMIDLNLIFLADAAFCNKAGWALVTEA